MGGIRNCLILGIHLAFLTVFTSTQDCNFERGTCSYIQSKNDTFDWTRQRQSTGSRGTGPSTDHTSSTAGFKIYTTGGNAGGAPCVFPYLYRGVNRTSCVRIGHIRYWCGTSSNYDRDQKWGNCAPAGWYMYIESSYRRDGDTAVLFTPTIPTGRKCMTFFYHMYGPHISSLSVYVTSDNTTLGTAQWSKTGTQGNAWQNHTMTVSSSSPFQVGFEGKRGSGYQGDIAIDDISFKDGPCGQMNSDMCTFETDMCGFVHDPTGKFNWTRHQGTTGSYGTGPNTDHTKGTAAGYYLYVEASSPRRNGDKARVSKQLAGLVSGGSCLKFWYHMFGADTGRLNVYVVSQGKNTSWNMIGQQGNQWAKGQITIPGTTAKVIFEGVIGNGYQGDIAIDDISVMNGKCSSPGKCDFETNLCTWYNARVGDNFDWIVGSGSTQSFFTGPTADHNGNRTAKYLFVESSSPRVVGDKAYLVSTVFNQTSGVLLSGGGRCFTFWYHMYGASIGRLNVYVNTTTGGRQLKWRLIGDQGNKWYNGQVNVGNSRGTYSVTLEGVRGNGYTGDIAIDDFMFRDGSCSIVPAKADPSYVITTVAPTTTPTPTPSTGNTGYDCNFEQGICSPSWNQDTNDTLDWTRRRGSTPSVATGPSVDHTLGTANGYYIYLEVSGVSANTAARFVSASIPATTATNGRCLQFWYHMYGPHVNTLNVYVKVGTHLGSPIWSKNGTHGDKWNLGAVTVRSPYFFKIIFEALAGTSYQGDIALDDISLSNSPCIAPSTTCTFEDGSICSYTHKEVSSGVVDFKWARGSGQTSSFGTGPGFDHTLGTSSGFYMFTEASSPRNRGDKAQLISPTNAQTTGTCLQFWYHMYGADIGTLNVFIRTGNTLPSRPIWSENGNQGNSWKVARKSIVSTQPYEVVFEGVIGTGYQGDIAIDDVKITNGPCSSPGYCTFENGNICSYSNANGDDFDWITRKGITPSFGTGPAVDHTTGGSNGTYLFIEASSPRKRGDKARLVSEQFNNLASSTRCLTFWYHMYGADIGKLNVIYKTPSGVNSERLIWNLTGQQQTSQRDAWRYASVPVSSNTDHSIIFEGIVGGSYAGDIALDDIQFTTQQCTIQPPNANPNGPVTPGPSTAFPSTLPPTIPTGPFNCDFEAGFCQYGQDPNDHFNWTRSQGYTHSAGTGPGYDHTKGKGAVGPRGPGSLLHVGGKCIHVLLGAWTKPANDQPLVTYVGCGQQRLEFVLMSNGLLKHTIYGQCVRPKGGAVADGTEIGVSNSCGPHTWRITAQGSLQHIQSGKCVIPKGGYSNPPDNNRLVLSTNCGRFNQKFSWQPTLGWYAFIESSAPRRANDTARLTSKTQMTVKGKCLNFWYHMYGPHINQLNVYLKANANISRPVWSKFGTHGDAWKPAHVLMNQNPPFQIVFEAVRGNGYQGDIAIDDISVTATCPAPLECSFEETNPPLCGWMNVRGRDRIDWSRATGATASTGTGPANDHTYGNSKGYYMYIETSGWSPTGANAYLLSPQYQPASRTGGNCLQFWYHMYGSSIGTLNVYIKTGTAYPGTKAWTMTRNQGNQWLIGQVSITTSSGFNVIFEGVRGTSYTGDIAIDDIKMMGGTCNQPASCDFENDKCTWTNTMKEDVFDWIISKGSTPSGTTGPTADHTKRNGDGTYAYIESSAPRKRGDKARFISERFPRTTTNRCLRFWYHMYGASIGTLNVLMKYSAGNTSSAEKVIWSLSGNKGQTWRYGAVPIRSTKDFQMIFEGIRGNGYTGDIAIDDVSYTVGSCSIIPSNAVPRPPTTSPPSTARPSTPTPTGYGCDFQTGFCSWTKDASMPFNWTRHRGSTSSVDTGPAMDHTLKNASGYYIYIETSSKQPNDKARIISAPIAADGRMGHCVKFWYHMYGPSVNALNLYKKVGNNMQLAWKRVGNNGNRWRYGQVSVSSNLQYQIVFEGVRGTSFNGDIALDDVDIVAGVCPAPNECDWEHGFCAFTQDSTDDFDWTRQKGSTPSIGTGPAADHTLQTSEGYYIYTEMSGLRRAGDKARIVSPVARTNDAFCLEFWYHMKGSHVGTLNVYRQSTGVGSIRSIIWSRTGNHGDSWNIARVTVSAGGGRQVTFEGVRGRGFSGDIALDDVRMIPGNCPPPGDCNFETGTCTWINPRIGDDFDWLRGSGSTASFFTGPAVDHTTGTAAGSYMFIETSDPRKTGDVAYLASEMFSPTSSRGRCIKFWYHMKGGNIGTLNVNLRTQNGTKIPVWSLTGQQGNNWLYGQAPIRSTVDYQMIFEGVRGNGFQGDIAIDDVEFVNFACTNLPTGSVPVAPTTQAPSTPASTKPPTPAPSPWNCNFTKDKCSWTDDATAHFNWTRHQGSTGSSLTGPKNDHTTGTASGWYIFIETSYPRVPNDTARLVSARVPSTNRKCLEFWYHMYGDHVDNLTIYMKTGSGMTKLWQKSGTQGDRWRHGVINVVSSRMFQIVFEGTRGTSYRGDIALDDISLNDGYCPPQAECTFEDPNLCGWTNIHGDNFDWTRASGSTASVGTGPRSDHTYGTSQGYYVYIEASAPRSKGHKAWLRSPVFKPSAGRCLQFWYHMYGYNVGTLNVLTYSNGSRSTPLYSLKGNQGNVWRIAQVTIASTINHQIMFEASVGTSYSGDIAIDDVLITDGACPLPGNCQFETGMCTYMNVKTGDNFDWLIGSGGTASQFTGPTIDHTTGTKAGRYLFIETSYPRLPNEKAQVESEVIMGSSTGMCLSFWYHMKGSHIGTLNVYLKIIGISKSILWSLSNAQGSNWLQGQVPIKSGRRNFQVVFEGVRGQDYQGDIALDDISLQAIQGSCSLRPTSATPWGCNFEQNTCNWRQTTDDTFDWKRYRGRTGSVGTGPNYDHTLANYYGYYMYIETSAPRRPNDTARFISSTVSGNGTVVTRCVTFYYHMYGPHVNTLSVYTRSNGRYDAPLWVRNGTQGPNWRYGEVQVKTGDSFQVVFEGKRGLDFKGDIAIDDIDIKYGDCISSGTCTFEAANICGWVNSKTDNFDWSRASGNTASVGTGPRNDHTYGTNFGHYLYIETSSSLPAGSKAIVNTPYFYNNGQKCVQFYYHMFGNTVGQLNVYVKYSFFANQLLFTKSGNQNNTWHLAQLQISRRTYFRMVFEGIKGSSYTGDIAIDDFKIRDGACPTLGDCDFEDADTCSWTNSQSDDFDWIIGRGNTPSFLTGPKVDHTTGTASGYYGFIESSAPRQTGDKAILSSMVFPATTGSGRCISFWYHMYGGSVGTFNIFRKTFVGSTVTGTQLMWQLRGNQGNSWLQGRIPLNIGTNYQILFEAIRGTSFNGDIAIDDIEFTQGSCTFTPYAALPPGMSTAAPTPSVTPSRGPTAGNTGFDCNFEKGWCTYTTNSSARFTFKKHQGHTASVGTGPHYDHTFGNSSGTYVYAEASSPARANDTTQLTSGEMPAITAPGKCLSFWYHMYGPHVGSLRVLTKVGSVASLKWQRSGTQGDEWKRGLVQLPITSSRSRVVFEALRGVSYSGDIAIDDIAVLSGTCPPPDNCDFEYSVGGDLYCQYTQDKTDDFEWTRANGRTASYGTGPATDHTLQTNLGYYMYIETSSPRSQGDKARFVSAMRQPTTGTCMKFWYHMYGSTIGSLTLYRQANSARNLLWTKSGDQGNIWRPAMQTLRSATNYQVVFEGTVGSSYTGDIAIDDIRMFDGVCPAPGDCDFENFKMCTYMQGKAEDDFDWIRSHGGTTSWRTGPSTDNTKKDASGHYMFIEASSPRKRGDKARLVSEIFPATGPRGRCVKFAFHMYGTAMGTLNVYVKTGPGNQSESLIWSTSGDHGNFWFPTAQAPVVSTQPYSIVFEGVVGRSYTGDIAIDDISYTNFRCTHIPASSAPPTVAPTTTVPSDSNCTFESGICNWSQLKTDNFDWTRNKDNTGSVGTGPLGDHTTGKGHYLYIETSSPRRVNDSAIIESPPIRPSRGIVCLQFWYHMHGAHVNQLNVYKKGVSSYTKIWTRKGTQGDRWRPAQVNVYSRGVTRIRFEGVSGSSYQGDIAIDDVVVLDSICPKAMYCDFEDTTLCGWQNKGGDQFDWTRANQGTPSLGTGPTTDHTTGTAQGNYLYIETSVPQRRGNKAWIYSPDITKAPKGKCLNFWYHMYGADIGALNIYLDRATGNPIWNRTGDQGNVWRHGRVNLMSHVQFKVVIEGVVGRSYRGDIAIDDVYISETPCPPAGSCDFEYGSFCTWSNVANGNRTGQDDFDWETNSGATGSYGTGPTVDHTLGNALGTYIFIETSGFNRRTGEKARLESELFTATNGRCFSFWYHMYGQTIGALNIYMKNTVGETLLKTYNGSQGNVWKEGEVGLYSRSSYRVILEATRGSSYQGDISLDDLLVKDGNCVGLCSSVVPRARVRCGGYSVSSGTCQVTLGCCYDDSVPNVPYCFYHPASCSAVPVNARTQCGAASISRTACQNLGCCYDASSLSGVSCYHTLAKPTVFPSTQAPITTPAPSPYDCNFDGGLCQFVNKNDDDFDWTRDRGGTPSSQTGPSADHTQGNSNGYYMYIETSWQTQNDTANLESPLINFAKNGNAQGTVCVRFWYHMYGTHVDALNVFISTRSISPIWTRQGTQGDKWRLAQIVVNRTPAFKITFQGTSGPSYQGDIAIDDVSFVNGDCPPLDECEFESPNVCGYTQDISDDFDWTRATANTTSFRTGPPADHTYGTAVGHYMHIEASYPRQPGDRAVMESPVYAPTLGGKCVEFYYHMYGADMGSIRIFLRKGGKIDRTPVWSLSGNQGNSWHRGSFTVQTSQNWKIVFEGIRGGSFTSDAALDDITIHKGPCPSKGSCDFERGMCGYTNLNDDKFDWIRHSGQTPSVKTGPKTDHTLGTSLGQYMYIEASSPRKENDYAHLASELFTVNPQFNWCVSFYYHMYGLSSGTLVVESLYRPSWGRGRKYYRSHKVIRGNQGDRWNWMQVDITQSYDFQIVFEGKIGKSYDGDISLDDVSVSAGKCPVPTPSPSPNPCAVRCRTNNRCVAATKICDFVNDCGASDDTDERNCGACDFETGYCQWNDTSTGVFDWKRGQGTTATVNTGPSTDHTKGDGTGYYAYVEASTGGMYSLAVLQSPSLKQASATCQLNFWYHMFGTGIGILRVYIEVGTSLTLLWQRSGNQGNQWLQASVYIMRRTTPYRIKIEAERSYSTRGDIAVDDISLQGCALPTPAGTCYAFTCSKTRACISRSRVCDFTDDCGDGTDEINCMYPQVSLRCNFEYSLCYWRQMTDDQFNWTRSYGATDSAGTGPLYDHTSGSNYGKYIYAEASLPRKQGDKARIRSSNLLPTTTTGISCMLRFYYHMNGDHIGRLSVKTRQCDVAGCPETLVWTRNTSTGDVWVRHSSYLRSNKAFQVIIEAERGSGYMGDIAIDDVSFYGCVPTYRPLPTPAPSTTPIPTTTPCLANQFFCPGDGTCIDKKKRCDFNIDCKDRSDEKNCGNCDFETDSCGYKDASTGLYMWGRQTPSLNPVANGPATDNTKKTDKGYLMMIKDGTGSVGRSAYLRSPFLSKTGPQCALEFYYYMNGTSYRSFGVYAEIKSARSRLFLTTTRTKGMWKRHLTWVGTRPAGWRLRLTGYRTLVAFDDIKFINCSLAPDRGGQCRSNEFGCSNGACISGNKICDFQDDCGDGSDESPRLCSAYKERCSFENGYCNWLQIQGDNFDWLRRRGSTGSVDTGPGTDHTKGNYSGYYLYIETSAPRLDNDTAQIISAPFKPVTGSNDCALRFYYHMFGDHVKTLTVWLKTSAHPYAPMKKVWMKQGNQGDFWYRGEVNLSFMKQNFRVVFEGTRGGGFKGDIAIDDVSFTPGCNVDFSVTLPPAINTVSPPPGCQSGQFKCANGKCISAKLYCDLKNDCSDGSDEASCPSSCDFETNECQWHNTRMGDRMDWRRHRGKTASNGTGPSIDHTTNSTKGYYIYLEATQLGGGPFPNAHFVSPLYIRGARNCKFNFWYNMWHWKHWPNLAFNVLYRRGGRDTVLWSTSTKTSDQWKAASVQLPNCPTDFQIVLEARHFWRSTTDVAVDDIGFQCTDPTPPPSCSANQFQCSVTKQCVDKNTLCDNDRNCCDGSDETDALCKTYKRTSFETGFDVWTQLQNDDFDWTLTSGHTGSFDTGPSRDHTLQEEHGKYIFMEASSPRKGNETTRLASPTIKGSGSRVRRATGDCRIRFFYHMYGFHVGTLNIYIATVYGQPGTKVWSASDDKGDQWLRGEVQLTSSADFQVIIEGIVGSGYSGDISLDDISFTPGCNFNGARLPGQPTPPPVDPCYPNFYCVKDRVCISRRRVCDFTPDCTGGTDEDASMCGYPCNFQNGFCGYQNAHDDDYDWQLHSQGTPSQGTGPSTDATGNKTGMYAYLEASQRRYNKIAKILSPTYGGSFADCTMVFYYHMYGANVGSLWLTLTDINGTTALWRYGGANKNQWMRGEATIGRRLHPFNISFYGIIGNGWQGDIAIDELNFANCSRPGPCKDPIGKHICRNGACIDKDKLCDLTDDCGDGSDEDAGTCQGYIGCDFENIVDQCNWTQATDDDFNWTRDNGGTPTVNSGPTRDHTYGTALGYYMYMEMSGRRRNQKARLVSIKFHALRGGLCQMRMFYHMFGRHTKDLTVYVQRDGSQAYTTVYTASGNLGDKWRKAVIDLSKEYTPFNVVIEGVRGISYLGDIAIDDITFTPDCITNGSRPIFPTKPPICGSSQFTCKSTQFCIPLSQKCNGVNDCVDGSDENKSICSGGKTGKQTGKSSTSSGVTAAIVVGCLVVILVIILVGYIVFKRKREKKLHLFSVFYDPTKQEIQQGGSGKGESKKKQQKQQQDTGLSNPVYDEKPFDDINADMDMGMFTEDSFTVPTDNEGGATSMANPLYQDPYYEEDGPMSEF